jgi:hypothetical protein
MIHAVEKSGQVTGKKRLPAGEMPPERSLSFSPAGGCPPAGSQDNYFFRVRT